MLRMSVCLKEDYLIWAQEYDSKFFIYPGISKVEMYRGDDVAKDYEAVGQCGITCGPRFAMVIMQMLVKYSKDNSLNSMLC